MELLLNVNWLAIGVGTVVSFLLGWAWYSPYLFVNKWAEGVGIDVSDGSGPMALAMVAQLVSTFLLAWGIDTAIGLGSLPFAVLIGFTVAGVVKANGFFAQKSMYAISVEVGFIVLMMLVMIGCSLWV